MCLLIRWYHRSEQRHAYRGRTEAGDELGGAGEEAYPVLFAMDG